MPASQSNKAARYYKIVIFSGNSSLDQLLTYTKSRTDAVVQLADPHSLISMQHAEYAVHLAVQRYYEDEMISRNLGIEVLLNMAGKTQIKDALSLFGLTGDPKDLLLIIIAESEKIIEKEMQEFQQHFPNLKMQDFDQFSFLDPDEAIKRFGLDSEKVKNYGIEDTLFETIALAITK